MTQVHVHGYYGCDKCPCFDRIGAKEVKEYEDAFRQAMTQVRVTNPDLYTNRKPPKKGKKR